MSDDIRWYKGFGKVKIIKKSRMNYLVEALEEFSPYNINPRRGVLYLGKWFHIGDKFTTVPRLLWRHPRK